MYLKEDCITKNAHQKRNVPQEKLGNSRVGKLVSGGDPSRCSLVTDEVFGNSAQLRDGLNGTCSTANDSDSLVFEINGGVPHCCMHNLTIKSLELRWDVGDTQRT